MPPERHCCTWRRDTHHLAFPTKSSMPGRGVFTSPIVAGHHGLNNVPDTLETITTAHLACNGHRTVKKREFHRDLGRPASTYEKLVVLARFDGAVFGKSLDDLDGLVEFRLRHRCV